MVIKKEQIKKFTTIAILLTFCLILPLPIGHAAKKDGKRQIPEMMCDFINEGVIDVLEANITSNDGKNEFYTYIIGDTSKPANKQPETLVTACGNAIKWICGFAVVILGIAKYFQAIEKDLDPVEMMYKTWGDIFMTAAIIINIDVILLGITGIGEEVILNVLSLSNSANSINTINIEMIIGRELEANEAMKFEEWLCSFVVLLVPWLMSCLLYIAALWTAYSLLIELGIRKAFAPIAICEIYNEGLRSPGVRYLKRYFATFIKIALCLLICYLGRVLQDAAIGNLMSDGLFGIIKYIFKVIAINFTIIGVINKTGEYANDIVGV